MPSSFRMKILETFVKLLADVHLCAFVMYSLSLIYQESLGFPWESPVVKMNSPSVFPGVLFV